MDERYSEIEIVERSRQRVARYVVISPAPEDDAMRHMADWAEKSGLLALPGYQKRVVGWDFPFVTPPQREEFGLRGYVCAFYVPEDFETEVEGAEFGYVGAGRYAKLTISDPFSAPGEVIMGGFERLVEFGNREEHKLEEDWGERYLIEEEYMKDGAPVMDIYYPVK